VVTAVKVFSNGDVWIGSDFGAAHYNGSSWTTYTETDGLGDDRIKTINELVNGDVAFGTNDGFTTFDGTDWLSFGTSDGLPFGGVASIAQNPAGVLYLGTALGGVIISDGGFTEITEDEGLLNDKVRAMVFDSQNDVWVGTSDGISIFNSSDQLVAQHTTMFTLPAPDTLNPVEDVVIDSQGNVWAGIYVDYLVTEGGICVYNGTEWVQFEVSDGLIGPVVRQLAVDSDDNIWVATSTGISKISDIDLGGGGNSILSSQEVSTLSIYPNPATDRITISLENPDVDLVEIFDASLRSVRREVITSAVKDQIISITGLRSGMYVIKAGNSVSKLIVE